MVRMTSFLTALLTRVLCKSLVSINVHNQLMKKGGWMRQTEKRERARHIRPIKPEVCI